MDAAILQFLGPDALLASVARAPYTPGQLAPFFTTESLKDLLAYIRDPAQNPINPTKPIARGGPRMPIAISDDAAQVVKTETFGWEKALYADSVLGRPEVLQQRVDKITAWLRQQADVQHEFQRLKAVVAASNVFGARPAPVTIALTNDATKLQQAIFDSVVVPMEAALGGLAYTGLHVFSSNGFWSAWLGNKERRETLIYQQSADLRADPRQVSIFGGAAWERYRGYGAFNLPENSAFAIPMGIDGMFVQAFAPDDTIDSIGRGAMGEPYYPNAWELPERKGFRLTMQTHPAMICTQPGAIIEIHLT